MTGAPEVGTRADRTPAVEPGPAIPSGTGTGIPVVSSGASRPIGAPGLVSVATSWEVVVDPVAGARLVPSGLGVR